MNYEVPCSYFLWRTCCKPDIELVVEQNIVEGMILEETVAEGPPVESII